MIGIDQARSKSLTTNIRVHAGELAVEPHFQILRRNRRPLPLRVAHAHRSTLETHVNRARRLGSRRSIIVRVGISRSGRNPGLAALSVRGLWGRGDSGKNYLP